VQRVPTAVNLGFLDRRNSRLLVIYLLHPKVKTSPKREVAENENTVLEEQFEMRTGVLLVWRKLVCKPYKYKVR
jgi:hypothetical protein